MVRVDIPRSGMKRPLTSVVPSRSGSTQRMAANIKVVVRVRPPNAKELEANSRIVVDVVDDKMLVFDPKEEQRPFFYQGVKQPNRNFLKRANKELKFVFDNVCSQDSTNRDVFELTTKEILTSLMEGYNCSVFVYGATGAGKTFTMLGNIKNPGITYLTMEHLFYSINSFEKDRDFEIGVSYIEVYNENVFDLLKPSTQPLQLREDSKYGVMVAGLTLNYIKTAQELLDMLENGNKNRTQHPTDANAESSRSHAVFQVYIKMRYKTSSQVRMVKLSMIDLAGSERAAATGCSGDRFKEGANINRSLLSLGNCINKLADGSNYIPYRDSKLTRLLKDSLGGNCRTVMIANVSPSSLSYEDTYNTLKYAARANKIQLSIKKNIVDGDVRASQYVKLNEELKKKNKELEEKKKELEEKLASFSVPAAIREPDPAKLKAKKELRLRVQSLAESHACIERNLLAAMCSARVLALRQRLKARARDTLAELAHRSSSELVDQLRTEDIPRQDRATNNYLKQSVKLDAKIRDLWIKWCESRKKFQAQCEHALKECPDLIDFIKVIQLEAKMRQIAARDDLRHKIVLIENDEINAITEYMGEMPSMLKKLFLTLKGYGKATPALTDEYYQIMKKAKTAKSISWSDEEKPENADPHFKFITNLEIDEPTSIPDFNTNNKVIKEEPNAISWSDEEKPENADPHFKCITKLEFDEPTSIPDFNTNNKVEPNSIVDIVTTDSEDLTDIENKEPLKSPAIKRKGTPIKLANNETIIIDDSFEALDVLSSKKPKPDMNNYFDIENHAPSEIDPKDLNSTFVLAGKIEGMMNKVKQERPKMLMFNHPVKRGLTDTTNTIPRGLEIRTNANQDSKAKPVVKPTVGKTAPFRRPTAVISAQSRSGFGSSLSRDGTPLQRNTQVGFKAVRARERVQAHPYSRSNPSARR